MDPAPHLAASILTTNPAADDASCPGSESDDPPNRPMAEPERPRTRLRTAKAVQGEGRGPIEKSRGRGSVGGSAPRRCVAAALHSRWATHSAVRVARRGRPRFGGARRPHHEARPPNAYRSPACDRALRRWRRRPRPAPARPAESHRRPEHLPDAAPRAVAGRYAARAFAASISVSRASLKTNQRDEHLRSRRNLGAADRSGRRGSAPAARWHGFRCQRWRRCWLQQQTGPSAAALAADRHGAGSRAADPAPGAGSSSEPAPGIGSGSEPAGAGSDGGQAQVPGSEPADRAVARDEVLMSVLA